MKKITYIVLFLLSSLLLRAQNPDGNYNPYVNGGVISPSPLLPVEVNGTGIVSFNIGNSGSDPLDVFPGQNIILTITLSYGEPNNANPLAAISGSAASLFSWSYGSGTYSASQVSSIPSGFSGTISIAYKVIQNSVSPGSNGFNVNITPAPYMTTSNTQNDDAVSSYTYTEIRDYGDAPAAYGSADHTLDFANYLGILVDGEASYLASSAANGDDLNGQDDEDGVSFPAQIHRGETVNLPVTITGIGRLNAWADWNGDGDFADAGERIADNVPRFDGTQNLIVNVPSNAIISAPTFMRFRYSPGTLSASSGSAAGGEVEDYQISISCAPPPVTLTSSDTDNAFCAGTGITFTATGGINYNFRIAGSTVQNGTSPTFTTTTLINNQVVDVIVTDANSCTATSAGITNTVHPLPVPGISSSDTDNTFCLGSAVTFTATGGINYNFRINSSSVQNGSSPTFTTSGLVNGQVVNVIVSDVNGCSASSAGITNIVNPLPVPTLTSSDADSVFCAGTSVTFTAGGGTNYNFRINGTSVQNSAAATYSTTGITNGQVVDVIVRDANGCQATSGGITNTVTPLPTVNPGVVLSAFCQGGTSLPLGGSVGGSATGGTWSTTSGGTFSPGPSNLNATWTPPAGFNGTATLVLTSSGGTCGTVNASKTQLVNPLPVLLITNPPAVCSPSTVNLTNPAVTAGSTAGLTYSYWTNSAGTNPYATPSAAAAGTYYIRGMIVSTGCSDIKPVIATVNPAPATPVVNVTDNCDGTSVLSTTATGSLLWNTGATTSSIMVTTSGVYSVTATVNGCTSQSGTGTASPNVAPSPPQVITANPVNLCPALTVNLTSLISSTTPAGGVVLYKTSNNPLGTNVTNPAAAGAGTYYLFYRDAEGCYSTGTAVTVTINACPPDVTPTLVVSPNIMHGITTFNLIVRVTELNMVNTAGTITVNIPKDTRWVLPDGYVPTLTVLGTTALNNSVWTYTSDAINHIFTTSTVIPAGGSSTFGFRVSFNPGSTRGIYTITSQIVSGGGGEQRVNNNADSERIDYFQQ